MTAPGTPDDAAPDAPRRKHRRATGGVPAAPTSPPVADGPVLPGSPDDEDTGWGEASSGNDERLLRDVPPHW